MLTYRAILAALALDTERTLDGRPGRAARAIMGLPRDAALDADTWAQVIRAALALDLWGGARTALWKLDASPAAAALHRLEMAGGREPPRG